eukprot:1323955-Prymnesium_polylepis.1
MVHAKGLLVLQILVRGARERHPRAEAGQGPHRQRPLGGVRKKRPGLRRAHLVKALAGLLSGKTDAEAGSGTACLLHMSGR